MADGEGSTDHLARRCENRHRPPASRRANTHTGSVQRTNTCWRARAASTATCKISRMRRRRTSETAATGEPDDRAAIARRCALSNFLT